MPITPEMITDRRKFWFWAESIQQLQLSTADGATCRHICVSIFFRRVSCIKWLSWHSAEYSEDENIDPDLYLRPSHTSTATFISECWELNAYTYVGYLRPGLY